MARSTTRRPWSAWAATLVATSWSPGARNSGAPRYTAPWPSKAAADHFRAEENGTVPVTVQPGSSAWAQADGPQRGVGVGVGRRHGGQERSPATRIRRRASGSTPAATISPVVMVPVLSRHNVSTRASSSTEASSRSSALRRDSFTTPAMNATLVSSTRPSGTMDTAAATVPERASCQSSLVSSNRHSSTRASGGRAIIRNRRIRLIPVRSSECTSVKRRASPASEAA